MTVSVAWLLRQKSLQLTLLTSRAAARREIEFVQPTELEDPRPWLSGGELVLTTGLMLLSNESDVRGYVERLHEKGAAALAFGAGLSHSEVPQPLIDVAEGVGLPLLRVPFTTPFAAVTKAVMSRLAQQEYEQVLTAAQVQTRITRAAVREGLSAILRELSVATGDSVAFVGRTSAVVHPTSERRLVDEVRTMLRDNTSASRASMSISEPGRSITVYRVGLGDVAHGHLAIVSVDRIGNIAQILLGHAASLLTLDLEKPVRLRADRTRLNGVATGIALEGNLLRGLAPQYLDDAGDIDGRVRVAIIESADPDEVLRVMDAALGTVGRTMFADVSGHTVTVLLPSSDAVDVVTGLVGDLSLSVSRSIRSGLSSAHPISAASAARDEARIAVGLASGRERIVEFDAFSGSSILGSATAREVLLTIASGGLDVLNRHDHEHDTSLIVSLRAYLEAHGQWESAANELGVHRHTLRGRIKRCEQLLDCDFERARVRAELVLALAVWDSQDPDVRAASERTSAED